VNQNTVFIQLVQSKWTLLDEDSHQHVVNRKRSSLLHGHVQIAPIFIVDELCPIFEKTQKGNTDSSPATSGVAAFTVFVTLRAAELFCVCTLRCFD
jgi:hypothetical protein